MSPFEIEVAKSFRIFLLFRGKIAPIRNEKRNNEPMKVTTQRVKIKTMKKGEMINNKKIWSTGIENIFIPYYIKE